MAAKITTMRDQVYEILKNNITSGKYRQGQWLQENTLGPFPDRYRSMCIY